MIKKILYIFLIILLVAIGAVGVVAYSFLGKTFDIDEDAYLYIYPEDDLEQVNAKLTELAHPTSPLSFTTLTKIVKKGNSIKTGRYKITPDMNMLTLIRNICNHHQDPLNIVVPSTRTVNDLVGKISSKLMVDSVTLMQLINDSIYCASLGYTKDNIPALFIPNTYEVYWDTDAEHLLKRMKKENDAFWNKERRAKAKALGMTPEEVVTLASIVDAETSYNPEKTRVAGLYLNRLATGMPLQSDPTVIYALGDFSIRRVLHDHLQVESPYNTYKNQGLPPGPIRIASIAAIDAVLNHETHDYLYMCAKEDFSGSHNFATNFKEHTENAKRYSKELNKRGIRR